MNKKVFLICVAFRGWDSGSVTDDSAGTFRIASPILVSRLTAITNRINNNTTLRWQELTRKTYDVWSAVSGNLSGVRLSYGKWRSRGSPEGRCYKEGLCWNTSKLFAYSRVWSDGSKVINTDAENWWPCDISKHSVRWVQSQF